MHFRSYSVEIWFQACTPCGFWEIGFVFYMHAETSVNSDCGRRHWNSSCKGKCIENTPLSLISNKMALSLERRNPLWYFASYEILNFLVDTEKVTRSTRIGIITNFFKTECIVLAILIFFLNLSEEKLYLQAKKIRLKILLLGLAHDKFQCPQPWFLILRPFPVI